MFLEVSAEVADLAGRVYAMCEKLERGDVLTHEAVTAATGMVPHAGHWRQVMNVVRRRMRDERGIAFLLNYRGGLRLCTVPEQIALVAEGMRRAGRQIVRRRKDVAAVPDAEMSDGDRFRRAVAIETAKSGRAALAREQRLLAAAASPPPPPPFRVLALPAGGAGGAE